MGDDGKRQAGLSRRELEREVAWMTRHLPNDPKALVKLITDVIVTLIDKNNLAIGRCLPADDEPGPGGP
jgi:hypothetical protein